MRSGVFLANVVVFTRYCAETMVREFEGEIKKLFMQRLGIGLDTVI